MTVRALFAALAVALSMPALAADIEANKKIVVDFHEKALNQRYFEAAAQHFEPRYFQHHPNVADGPNGLKRPVDLLEKNSRTPAASSSG